MLEDLLKAAAEGACATGLLALGIGVAGDAVLTGLAAYLLL